MSSTRLGSDSPVTRVPTVARALLRVVLLVGRSVCWATLLGGGITAIVVWRSAPLPPMTRHMIVTVFGITWALAFILSLILELLTAHFAIETGDERTARQRARQ